MNGKKLWIALPAVLAFALVLAAAGQQKGGDTAVDPVCGMTVVKSGAKAAFDYQGTTYYFCATACKEAFAKDPEKYLKAQAKGEEKAAPAGMMPGAHMEPAPMAGCPKMARRMPRGHRMPGMRCGTDMACGPNCPLHGADVDMTVEKIKDGAVLKVTSKNAETVKAIQEHMTEHAAMMKKMKDAAAQVPEEGCCANCPMKKK